MAAPYSRNGDEVCGSFAREKGNKVARLSSGDVELSVSASFGGFVANLYAFLGDPQTK